MNASQIVFTILLIGAILMDNPESGGGEPSPSWAIAIHGGAGGDPQKWDDRKVAARKNGLKLALQAGRDSLAAGGSAIDTVEAVIRILEDDANFNAGRGAVLTEDGNAELDASIMDGKSHQCGAVAGVTRVKNPITLARRVMTETKHVLLAGPGADEFAADMQVPLVDPDYFLSRHHDSRNIDAAPGGLDSEQPHFGTVGCVALDSDGNLAAGTSTGGTAKKLPGRVGDSPIVGAGTYAANDTCAVSGTGIGEEYIRNSVAYDIAAQIRYAGQSLASAVTVMMQQRLQPGVGGLIAVSNRGEIVMQHNTPGMSCGAADSRGRFETHLLLDRGGADIDRGDDDQSNEAEIRSLIGQQSRDWNSGDIEAFMSPYWKNDGLTFSSGGEITRGFDSTLARYRERYPTTEAMGQVTFTDLEFLPLGPSAMQVLGTWSLDREPEPMSGRFTLILRRFAEGWRIVHDHTSRLPATEEE